MIPLYGFLEGDSIGLLILAYPDEKISSVIAKLQSSASLRVKPKPDARLIFKGKSVDPELSVAEAKMQSLDRFDVRYGGLD